MKPKIKNFAWHFAQLIFTTFLLFFLTVGLGKASADLVIYINDAKTHKSVGQWVIFAIGAPTATAIWCIIWLWFKKSEKHCIELLSE